MDWILFTPELFFLFSAGVFLVLSMTRSGPGRYHLIALILSAVGVGICLAGTGLRGDLFYDTYRIDLFSQIFKVMLSAGFFLVVCLCEELEGIPRDRHAEFYLLLTLSTLAMMALVSSVHLLTIYIALELSSYSLYILVALRKGPGGGISAGIKYFLIGASASALMLFGLALIYGSTRSAYVVEILAVLPEAIARPEVILGLLFVLCGFFFKLALFPFHFWAPDVYAGAANQVSAYIATASKVAAVGILIRMTALGGRSPDLAHALAVLAVVSMTLGNLAAIAQKDLKRLLAYSSIAHAGYVTLGILTLAPTGYGAAMFYALSILVMKFTCFLVVVKVAPDGGNPAVEDLAGLHRRSPILALALMLALFGLAGIPPTIGFTGKLLLFTAAIEAGYLSLVIIAMINVVISLYYYLLVLKAAYLLEPGGDLPPLVVTTPVKVLAGALIGVMIGAGIYPQPLIEVARSAAQLLF